MLVNTQRTHALNEARLPTGTIVYWMTREQRVHDNWSLLYARELAGSDRSLIVMFCLAPSFLGATLRQYDFMLKGLAEVEKELSRLGIPFALCIGDPATEVTNFVSKNNTAAVITDFDPLRIKQRWQKEVASNINVPFIEVDGHNIVPARRVSDKQEYAARTIRPKIHRLSSEFLEEYPTLEPLDGKEIEFTTDWAAVHDALEVDESVRPIDMAPGESAAKKALHDFIAYRLNGYAAKRNDPNAEGTSRLSAYFHFGHLSPQRAALEVMSSGRGEDQEAYLEELIVRRELTDNFCLHNPHYDTLQGAPPWALKTLEEHRHDDRSHLYSYDQFEQAKTHSQLWNAAQKQLLKSGYMHGYMRMFWAKKILEWSVSPEEAHSIALKLNDRYQLDGRDPNGYVGALWSIAGLHDRAWKTRAVYGSIRYMNENGCRRKFDVEAYCKRWLDGE